MDTNYKKQTRIKVETGWIVGIYYTLGFPSTMFTSELLKWNDS